MVPHDNDAELMAELVCKIPIKKGDLARERDEQDNLLKLTGKIVEAPSFEELSKDLGQKLLNPLKGRCFDYVR